MRILKKCTEKKKITIVLCITAKMVIGCKGLILLKSMIKRAPYLVAIIETIQIQKTKNQRRRKLNTIAIFFQVKHTPMFLIMKNNRN